MSILLIAAWSTTITSAIVGIACLAAVAVQLPRATPVAAFGLRALAILTALGISEPLLPSLSVVIASVAVALGLLAVIVMIVADLVDAVRAAITWRCAVPVLRTAPAIAA